MGRESRDFRRDLLFGDVKPAFVQQGVEAGDDLLDLLLLADNARGETLLIASGCRGCLLLGLALVGCDSPLPRQANGGLKLPPQPIAQLRVNVWRSVQRLQTDL